jgi:hypothetical protein
VAGRVHAEHPRREPLSEPSTAVHPGAGGRPQMDGRGDLPVRQGPGRTGRAPSQTLDVLAPLGHPRDARPRLPRHRPRRRPSARPVPLATPLPGPIPSRPLPATNRSGVKIAIHSWSTRQKIRRRSARYGVLCGFSPSGHCSLRFDRIPNARILAISGHHISRLCHLRIPGGCPIMLTPLRVRISVHS